MTPCDVRVLNKHMACLISYVVTLYISQELSIQLYMNLVRPHLDYSVQFRSTHYRKNAETLQNVEIINCKERFDGLEIYQHYRTISANKP